MQKYLDYYFKIPQIFTKETSFFYYFFSEILTNTYLNGKNNHFYPPRLHSNKTNKQA